MSYKKKLNATSFGVVQGRLTQSPPGCLQWFPNDHWKDEFIIASDLGIDYIELIAETKYNSNNPIWSDEGIIAIKELVDHNNLKIYTLCNDYVIENSILNEDVIQWSINLIDQSEKLCIEKIIIPLFNRSEISFNNMHFYIEPLRRIAKYANSKGIVVCLETILTGRELINLLELINLPNVKVIYDTGNAVEFEHDLAADIRILGNYIDYVHIKDKDLNNKNVLLGTGMVDFKKVFEAFNDIDYRGPFTFETTRGSDPVNTAKYNINFANFFIKNAELSV
jgi:sugar phosphate isomerase/epimerase